MANSPGPDPDPRLQGLIKRLLELTQKGIIHWSRDLRRSLGESYSVSLTEATIRIRSLRDNQRPPHVLQIMNSEGILIDDILAENPEEADMLTELYRLARREALNVDGVIDSLIRELNEEEESRPE
jgi:hypothetical protein